MSPTNVLIYFLFAFLCMVYTFSKVGINRMSILMVLVFWEGLFDYLGVLSIYKIGIVVFASALLGGNNIRLFKNKNDFVVNIAFILFTFAFWISYYIYGGSISTMLSQYLYKYAFLWIAFHYFKDITHNISKREYVKNMLMTILYTQISISIVKIILFRFEIEGLVGSMSYGGGGPAVVVPIVSLIFYWLIRNGSFNKKDWIIVLLIMTISIASGKRQPIVFFPAILVALFVFVSQSARFSSLLKYIPIAFTVFYIGVRMTSTFTPEKVVGGRFDISFVTGYVLKYYFGTNEISEIIKGDYQGVGRGAGVLLYFKPRMLTLSTDKELLFGKGLYDVAIQKYGRFTAGGTRSNYGIQHSGLIGAAGELIYSMGYLSTIFLLFLSAKIIFSMKNKRLAWVMYLYFLWDFLFYYNQMLFFNSSGLVVLITIFYANSYELEKKRYLNHSFRTAKSQ